MAVRGKREVKKFRGVVRGQMKRASRAIFNMINRQVSDKTKWMTPDEFNDAVNFNTIIGNWLAQKISV